MANPFSGTITGANTGHTNYGALKYAVIPRSTSQVREIITGQNLSLSGNAIGSYDSDGYIIGGSTSATSWGELTGLSAVNMSGDVTIISGWKWMGSGGSSYAWAKLYNTGGDRYAGNALDTGSRRWNPEWSDGSSTWGSYTTLGSDHVGLATKSTAGTQAGGYVAGASSPPSGTYTGATGAAYTFISTTMTKISLGMHGSWGFQYMFVYGGTGGSLSDADIEAIIENPGAVLAFEGAAAGVPKTNRLSLLGVG